MPQRKLIVGPVGDAFEREADEVARRVLEGWHGGSVSPADERLARSVSAAGAPADGALDPDSDAGVQLLAFELTHTLQQDSAVQQEWVPRDIGFEFDTQDIVTRRIK
jgi:Domain of unknown function (DUF4157)